MQDILHSAANLLREHYGEPAVPGPPCKWTTLVKVVLAHGRASSKRACDWEWLHNSPLAVSRQTAASRVELLVESLESAGYSSAKAAALHALAKWYERHFDDENAVSVENASLEQWRDELRNIRGVNLELSDRILLFVAGLSAYPVDRASLRITCRHGWMDLAADYEEWQAFFVRGMEGDTNALARLSLWNARVGKDYCGPRPACDDCPLRPLLPERGAVELDDVGE